MQPGLPKAARQFAAKLPASPFFKPRESGVFCSSSQHLALNNSAIE